MAKVHEVTANESARVSTIAITWRVLYALRRPLEDGYVRITRTRDGIGEAHEAQMPARFTLIAAMNPCPCGFHGSRNRSCTCTATQIERYVGRVPEWLTRVCERIDLPDLTSADLMQKHESEKTR